jgi:hypothetical protein
MERPGSELPVIYESPWRALGRDLRAVVASLRLGARQLWRRQWQGDLPVPGFWPPGQAVWFWPLLVLLVLVLLVPVSASLVSSGLGVSPGAETAMEPPQIPPAPAQKPAPPELLEPPEQPAGDAPEIASPMDMATAEAPSLPAGFEDPTGLVVSARCEPAAALLELRLSPPFQRLEAPERQRLAERWQEQAHRLGYDHLRLDDASGTELGRSAVVGGGMILLDRSGMG